MTNTATNNKRIAKNTVLLYIRMLFLMLVSLYTSRVNLNALGVSDFGIYNVVGGLVAMFNILSGSFTAAISRYLTYELGTGDKEKLARVFSSSMIIQYSLAIVIIIAAETIGLWFLTNKMVIPEDRINAAIWVYQLSLVSFTLDLLVIPYTACIVAHEKMSAFAYISIVSAIGKLIVAWTISIAPIDKLIWFAGLIVVNSTIIRSIYIHYSKKHFEECSVKWVFDKSLLRNISQFTGWNFIGSAASILRDYGGNIIINLFFGPTINAARGIASQVNNAVIGFVSNFQMALNPQITKSYALKDNNYAFTLVFQGARLSYYILLILVLPIIINTHYILSIWLGNVPDYSVDFVQLILIFSLNESLSNPLITLMLATGNIKKYQIIVGGLNLLNLPFSYILLKLGAIPQTVIIIAIIISIITEFARVILLKQMTGMSAKLFISKVYINVIGVTLFAAIVPVIVNQFLCESLLSFLFITVISILCTCISILFIGCNITERKKVYSKCRSIFKKFLIK